MEPQSDGKLTYTREHAAAAEGAAVECWAEDRRRFGACSCSLLLMR